MNDQQHQRSSSNVVMSNVVLNNTMEATQEAVADHFRKSLDNLNHPMGGQQQMKPFPPSFYKKPAKMQSSNQHSRDGSTDSSGYNSTQSPQSTASSVGGTAASVAHSRAHSSPATLTSNHLSIPPQQKNSAGRRETARSVSNNPNRSFDICNIDDDSSPQQLPLPLGWEKAYSDNGQPFYINRELKRTTFADPRQLAELDLGQLPYNWEEAYTAEGHKYFINHNSKVTTWYDPRLPEDVQRPTILQRHAMQQQQQQQQLGGVANPHMNNVGVAERMPPQGIYQPPTHSLHMAGAGSASLHGLPSHMMAAASNSRASAAAGTFSPNSQKRVHDLNRERQSYRQRQEEIMKQGLLSDHVSSGHPVSPVHNVGAETVGAYQCGGQGSSAGSSGVNMQQTGDYHFRQESTDSGLGMTTFGYSHPHTPENFLNSEFPPLNIAGIDLNLPSAMEVDSLEEIPEISLRDLDQVLNSNRSMIRY